MFQYQSKLNNQYPLMLKTTKMKIQVHNGTNRSKPYITALKSIKYSSLLLLRKKIIGWLVGGRGLV